MKLGELLDPLLWAKKPRAQAAMDLLISGAKEGDSRLAEIHANHLADGVCDDAGKLILRFDGVSFVTACV